jgi:carbon monoxide dehydrogenase subunit G
MKVEGTKVFDAPREAVWGVLMDPEKLASLLPGVDGFEIEDDTHWNAKVRVPLGMGGLKLGFSFEKVDEVRPERAALRAKGKGVGAIVSMETHFLLKEDGSRTAMEWAADVNVLGQVGSMGQRVLQPIVNQQVEGVLAALDQKVQEAAGQ